MVNGGRPVAALGASLGRYSVLESVGCGGMGEVLRAYDPTLLREVALKVVRPGGLNAEQHRRLLREARAMAKLSHPNVVAIFDVEETSIGIVLVMEFVRGQTLRQWETQGTRTWKSVLARYLGAGRGLAAAHAEGMVHRDFKPSNVLLAESTRDQPLVKVTDFGLAKTAQGGDPYSSEPPTAGRSADSGEIETPVTRVDCVAGTPRYMAPEQHEGTAVTAAADQYAFCVSMWQALSGAAPFAGSDPYHAKLAGAPRWPPDAPLPPGWLVAALRRGLEVDVDARWPGMEPLLATLARGPRRWGRGLAIAGSVGLVCALGQQTWVHGRELAEPCTGATRSLGTAWDASRRASVATAFERSDLRYAAAVWERQRVRLDAYAESWKQMHTENCRATAVRGEQSPARMDLRMACLRRARSELDAAATVLATGDPKVVESAYEVVNGLPPLRHCADAVALETGVEPPPLEQTEAVAELRGHLARAAALGDAGMYDEAVDAVESAAAVAPGATYPPVRVELSLARGVALSGIGRFDAATRAFEEVLRSAPPQGQWALVGQAANGLLRATAHLHRLEEALQYQSTAEGFAGDELERAAVGALVASPILLRLGRYAEVEARARRFLAALRAAERGDAAVGGKAKALSLLAQALGRQGQHAEAKAAVEASIAAYTEALGDDHPIVATALGNFAILHVLAGRDADAEALLRESIASFRRAVGPHDEHLVGARINLIAILGKQGKHAEAEAEAKSLLAFEVEAGFLGAGVLADLRYNLAATLAVEGKHEEAEAEFRRALALHEGPDVSDQAGEARARTSLAFVLHQQNKLEEAEAELRVAIPAFDAVAGPEHPQTAESKRTLADVLLDKGQPVEAVAFAEQAWALLQSASSTELDRGHGAFTLARALWASTRVSPGSVRRQSRLRARALADTAAAAFADTVPASLAEVERWLAEHP